MTINQRAESRVPARGIRLADRGFLDLTRGQLTAEFRSSDKLRPAEAPIFCSNSGSRNEPGSLLKTSGR